MSPPIVQAGVILEQVKVLKSLEGPEGYLGGVGWVSATLESGLSSTPESGLSQTIFSIELNKLYPLKRSLFCFTGHAIMTRGVMLLCSKLILLSPAPYPL